MRDRTLGRVPLRSSFHALTGVRTTMVRRASLPGWASWGDRWTSRTSGRSVSRSNQVIGPGPLGVSSCCSASSTPGTMTSPRPGIASGRGTARTNGFARTVSSPVTSTSPRRMQHAFVHVERRFDRSSEPTAAKRPIRQPFMRFGPPRMRARSRSRSTNGGGQAFRRRVRPPTVRSPCCWASCTMPSSPVTGRGSRAVVGAGMRSTTVRGTARRPGVRCRSVGTAARTGRTTGESILRRDICAPGAARRLGRSLRRVVWGRQQSG
jgi:hypothetical protein